jgi:hypothetical protein
MRSLLALLTVLCLPLLADGLPPDVAALKAKRDAKIAEINQTYATALEALQKKALREGNLDAANLIEKEIAASVPNPLKTGSVGDPFFVGSWEVTNSKNSRVKRKFTATHLIDEEGGKHLYKLAKNTITIEWGRGWEKLTVDPSQTDVLTGFNNSGLSLRYSRVD